MSAEEVIYIALNITYIIVKNTKIIINFVNIFAGDKNN